MNNITVIYCLNYLLPVIYYCIYYIYMRDKTDVIISALEVFSRNALYKFMFYITFTLQRAVITHILRLLHPAEIKQLCVQVIYCTIFVL